jgi:hypothetical protein
LGIAHKLRDRVDLVRRRVSDGSDDSFQEISRSRISMYNVANRVGLHGSGASGLGTCVSGSFRYPWIIDVPMYAETVLPKSLSGVDGSSQRDVAARHGEFRSFFALPTVLGAIRLKFAAR